MAIGDLRVVPERSALGVPYAVDIADRIRKERYYDPDFYAMEVELLWPRVWQMACRLEEIPRPHDFVEYELLDQSVVVVRTEDRGVQAFQNTCRHRGVRVAQGRGTCENGFTCPFHGWCYGPDGRNTFVSRARTFSEHNLQPGDIDLTPVRSEVWGGCAWINLDADAPPLRACLEPVASVLDAWKVESLRGTGGDADGDLVAHPAPGGRGAGPADAARAVGVRRPPLAADPRTGLLEPAPAAEGPARQGVRVHAAVRRGRGAHLELPPGARRVPRRAALRALLPALRSVNVNPLEMPVVELELGPGRS